MSNGEFRVRRITANDHGFKYSTFQLVGYLNGQRVRKKFKSKEEAEGEKARLEVAAANASGAIRTVNTRLTAEQVATAETLFALTPDPLAAVQWFIAHYRPPVTAKPLAEATAAFLADRKLRVRPMTYRDYESTFAAFLAFVGKRASNAHEISAGIALEFLESRKVGNKRWNNLRADLNAFFEWCKLKPRQWVSENPVLDLPKFEIGRDLPEIVSPAHLAKFFAFLETYTGEYGKPQPAGFLVPYFALATFAGLRPSVVEGEIAKIGALPDVSRVIDLDANVIRITKDIAKTKDVRHVTIQPNLRAWLLNYPLRDFPINVPNMKVHVTKAREQWGLKNKDDVLRHTFISMHVAKFKSIGQAALEAGNSEAIIKKHYLNREGGAAAGELFWAIAPKSAPISIAA